MPVMLRAVSLPSGQARLWVQLMRELRHGVKLKKVQEQEFNPLPTEFQLTPFEMLMQDIRARNYKLRKVMVSKPPAHHPCWMRGRQTWAQGGGEIGSEVQAMVMSPDPSICPAGYSPVHLCAGHLCPCQVDGDIPPRVKKDAHELILDFIRSRPPLKQVSALLKGLLSASVCKAGRWHWRLSSWTCVHLGRVIGQPPSNLRAHRTCLSV